MYYVWYGDALRCAGSNVFMNLKQGTGLINLDSRRWCERNYAMAVLTTQFIATAGASTKWWRNGVTPAGCECNIHKTTLYFNLRKIQVSVSFPDGQPNSSVYAISVFSFHRIHGQPHVSAHTRTHSFAYIDTRTRTHARTYKHTHTHTNARTTHTYTYT